MVSWNVDNLEDTKMSFTALNNLLLKKGLEPHPSVLGFTPGLGLLSSGFTPGGAEGDCI